MQKKEAALAARQGSSAKEISGIAKDYKPKSEFSLLVSSSNLSDVLEKFKRVRAFEYSIATLEPEFRNSVPIAPYVRRLISRATFHRNAGLHQVVNAIASTVGKLKPAFGKVECIEDFDGREIVVSVNIENIADNFGEFDFESISRQLDRMDLDTFYDHPIAGSLLDLCQAQGHIFDREIKD